MTERNVPRSYAIAIGITLASLLFRIALMPLLGAELPYIPFFPAILLSAWLGGLGPGLCSTLVGGIGEVFLVPALAKLDGLRLIDVLGFVLFLGVGGWISYLTARWRQATARLKESERIYRAIGETIDYGVWVCEPDGRNIYASESFLKLVGMTQEECSEFGWKNVLHPDDCEKTIGAWKECVQSEGTWDMEHRFLGVDGEYHHVLARGVPIRDERGRIVCWAGINLDISNIRKAERERAQLLETLRTKTEELSASNRELEQFTFAASHDLQEPLRTINIYTQLLLRDVGPHLTAGTVQYAQFVKTGVERLHSLITDLLEYSRSVHAESMPSTKASLSTALRTALESLQPLIGESGAAIDAPPMPDVVGDEQQLAQVFQNLISNAIKYRHPERPPRLTIRASIAEGYCTVSVSDNGIGFNPEYAEVIFGLFKRLHRDAYPGTGLGLAICKRIVERCGGRIWAESTEGEGSCFYFTLPLE